MRFRFVAVAYCLSLSCLAGCGGTAGNHPDQGPQSIDLATAAPADQSPASSTDLAQPPVVVDLATPGLDSGMSPLDAAMPPDVGMPPVDAGMPAQAKVRFVNAGSARLTGTDAGKQYAFDVYLSGATTPLISGLAFGQSSGWTAVAPAAGIKFDLRYAGDLATATPLFTTADADALDFSKGGQASIVVYGFSKINTTGGFKLMGLLDGFSAAAGSAAARFVNVSPVNSTYKLYLDPNGAPSVQVMANTATAAAGVALPAGADLPLLITNGTSSSSMFPASTDATWTLPAAVAANGKQLLLILTGQGLAHPRDPDAVVLVVVDESATAQVLQQDPLLFVVNAAPTAPAVDLQTDASKVTVAALAYKTMKHLSLPAGAGATIHGAAGGAALFASATGPLLRGERYLGLIAGAADGSAATPDGAIQLRVYQEQFAPAAAMMARLRVVNASPSAPALDVGIYYTANLFTPIQSGVVFPSGTDATGTQAAQKSSSMTTLSIGVGASGDATSLLPFSYLSQFDPDDPLFVVPSGDWSAMAASGAKKVIFVKAPIKSAWQVSGSN